jgi:hypothetical protein
MAVYARRMPENIRRDPFQPSKNYELLECVNFG